MNIKPKNRQDLIMLLNIETGSKIELFSKEDLLDIEEAEGLPILFGEKINQTLQYVEWLESKLIEDGTSESRGFGGPVRESTN